MSSDAAGRMWWVCAGGRQRRAKPRRRFLQSVEHRQWARQSLTNAIRSRRGPRITLGPAAAAQVPLIVGARSAAIRSSVSPPRWLLDMALGLPQPINTGVTRKAAGCTELNMEVISARLTPAVPMVYGASISWERARNKLYEALKTPRISARHLKIRFGPLFCRREP